MEQVHWFKSDDPAMQRANDEARSNFRCFWREMAWERRRIVPGLNLACVKVPFSDPPEENEASEDRRVEQMWLSEVNFDGKVITGTLINSPNWLTSMSEGDEKKVSIDGITDWMYAINGRVYGAWTVNLIRSRMDRKERAQHDQAWGLDFGDPARIEVLPSEWFNRKSSGGFLKRILGGAPAEPIDWRTAEHPMAVNMTESLLEQLQSDPELVRTADDEGWTFLHQLALAGSATHVDLLLKHGADPKAQTNHGMTALQLARSLDWKNVIAILAQHSKRS